MSVSLNSNRKQDSLIEPLSSYDRTSLDIAGGKGANLGELTKAGFDVPPGFVITTLVYDLLFLDGSRKKDIGELFASLDLKDSTSLARVSQSMREFVQNTPIPNHIGQMIIDAYHQLGGGAVAVRSSATAEDLPGAAFAGQQETFLNVIGDQALLEAVRACWVSLWSERAILYRARQEVDQVTAKLAVVIQQMVASDVAGVMFTANPVTGVRDELVIDANPGLGEAVVSGMVTPDHFLINKRSKRMIEQKIGKMEVVIRAKAGGGTEQTTLADLGLPGMVLPPSAIRKLTRLGIQIEQHFGVPQDIEWAWVKDGPNSGKFLILQARPMTALPKPFNLSGPMRMVVPMLVEMWPERPYPLDLTTFSGALEHAIGNFLAVMLGKGAPDPNKILEEEDGVVVGFALPQIHPTPAMLITTLLTLWRTRRHDPIQWKADPLLQEVVTQARQVDLQDLQSLSWTENIESIHQALALIPRTMRLRELYLPQALFSLGKLWVILRLVHSSQSMGLLLSGIETKTIEINRAMETLALEIRGDSALSHLFASLPSDQLLSALQGDPAARTFLDHFSRFLDQYGHRENALTVSQRTWKDQPEVVLGILKLLVAARSQVQTGSDKAWELERERLLARSILGGPFLRKGFLQTLSRARSLFQIREDTHFYATLTLPTIRHITLELGRRLADVGVLDHATDIFHLKLEEIEHAGEMWPPSKEISRETRELVTRRKSKRESLEGTPLFDPRILAPSTEAQSGENVILGGSAGSPGIASGPVRIIRSSADFGKLQAGDVLVAPVTNPSWTPLFQRAAAVVVDTGGMASHAAIVAREYGIPAVMGTMNGTQALTDGQWVQVDGSHGLVLKAEPQSKINEKKEIS